MTLLFFPGFLFGGIFSLLWIVLIIYTLLDIFKSSIAQNSKILWIIVVLVAPILGSLIYLFWGRHQNTIL